MNKKMPLQESALQAPLDLIPSKNHLTLLRLRQMALLVTSAEVDFLNQIPATA